MELAAIRLITSGLPAVNVPVLSVTRFVTFSVTSIACAFFTRTPACAARPTPTMIDIGVASPSAHGHAMISTETAFTSAYDTAGAGPTIDQIMKVIIAAPITAGTKYPDTVAASF